MPEQNNTPRKQRKQQPVDNTYGHLPPQALDVERAVLGALMIDKDAYAVVCETLRPESFYEPRNQMVYAAIRDLSMEEKPVDVLTVTDQLLTQGYVSGKPMIGVSFSDVSNSNYFFYYSVRSGVYVAELAKGYNDDVLKEGDRVIAVNGQEISTSEEIKAIVYASSIGDKLTFQLYRNGKLMEVEVTVYERTPDADVQNSITFDEDNTPNWLDDFFGNR